MLFRFVFLFFLMVCIVNASVAENLIRNSSFEDGLNFKKIPKYWGAQSYNQSLSKKAIIGKHSLKITNAEYDYSIGAQIADIDRDISTKYAILGYFKTKDVVAKKEDWQGAKVQVVFLDKNDQQIEDPIDLLRAQTGSAEWEMFIRNVDVPVSAKKIKLLVGLWGAKGIVWFDDIRMYPVKTSVKNKNLLDNGNFEIWGNWDFLGEGDIQVKYPGFNNSAQALYIKNNKPEWSFAIQRIMLKKLESKKLNFSGMVKYKNILAGQKDWQKGRIYLEFRDERGRRVGQREEILSVSGSKDWYNFSQDLVINSQAVELVIYCGLQNVTGEIVFDDLKLIEK